MAAEILDIEAKLDTSQVQGQLQQLSKTSGLQGLDRAIKTLEASMKKLSAQMDKAAQQAQSGGGGHGGRDPTLLGKGGLLLGSQSFVRSAGLYWGGKVLGSQADTLESRYGWKAGALAQVGKGAMQGAAFGPVGMAMGALTAATDAVHDHFQKLAEASDRLIAAKMKEWEAIDNAFAAMGVEIKDARMKAASAAMTPEERRKKIDELQTARTDAWSHMVENYDIADKLEGPMYDAAVQAASYWRDAVKDIDKNLAVLQGDNDKYVEGLRKAAAAAAHAAKEEQRLAEKRDRIRAGYADDVRGYEFSQKLEQLRGGAETKGMSKDELEGRVSQARGEYNAELYELNELRKEAIASANPEDYQERIKTKETEVNEKKQMADAWQQLLEDRGSGPSASLSDLAGMLGPTSSLASMGLGLGGELIEDKLLNNTDRMLALLRIVADNSKKWTQTETTNIATYQS